MEARQLALDLPHAPALSADDFVVADGNRPAFEHIRAWPDWTTGLTVVVGPAKSGKTHLADVWRLKSGAATAWAENAAEAALTAGPLVLEDVDRLPVEETALFNLVNQASRGERSMLVTARAPMSGWGYRTADVRSRLRLAAMFEIAPLDDALLMRVFSKLFRDRQVSVDAEVMKYVLNRMERSPAEVVALVELMDRIALSKGRAITRSVAADALAIREVQAARQAEPELDFVTP